MVESAGAAAVAKHGAIISTTVFPASAVRAALIPPLPSRGRPRSPKISGAAEPMQIKASNKFRYRSPSLRATPRRPISICAAVTKEGLTLSFCRVKTLSRGASGLAPLLFIHSGLNSQTLADAAEEKRRSSRLPGPQPPVRKKSRESINYHRGVNGN